MPELIRLYGAIDCDDSERTREHLKHLGIPFQEINIMHDAQAKNFVIFVNNGFQSTPTLVIGEGKRKIIMTEPTNAELEVIVVEAGYSLPSV
jgi:mycoredoxin